MKTSLIILFLAFSFPALSMEKIQQVKTDIGIDALLIENRTNPIVSVRINFKTGNAYDAKDMQGLSELYAAMLDKGAGEFDTKQFQEKLYENSISMKFSAFTEDFAISLQSLSSDYETAFSLLADCLQSPKLPEPELVILKQQMLAQIKIQKEQPKSEIFSTFKREIFENHPYGYGIYEKEKSIPNITKQNLQEYKKRFAKDNILISVSGDISASELKKVIERTFAFLPEKSQQTSLPVPEFIKKQDLIVIEKASPQSAVMFALPWVNRKSPEFFTGYLLNYILGGSGMDSILMQELREKQGLSYGISSFLYEMPEISLLMGFGATSNEKAMTLVQGIKTTLDEIVINEIQLADAKSYLIGAFPLTFASTMTTAELLMTIQKYDLGLDYFEKRNGYINAVTIENINAMAKQFLNTHNADFILMGE